MDQIFTMTTTFDLVPKVIKTKIAEVIKEHKTTILNCKKRESHQKTNTEYRHNIYKLQAHNISIFFQNLVSRFRLLHKQLVLHKRLISYYASGCYYISSQFLITQAVVLHKL